MTLKNILENIQNKSNISKKLMQASSGKKFEEQISNLLRKEGDYVNIPKTDWQKSKHYKDAKEYILSPNEKQSLLNIPGISSEFGYPNDRILIHQPHGGNNYPDFLLIYKDNILPLEIKYSTAKGEEPVWNSGYPRSKSLYIFGSYGLQDVTSFIGDDYMSDDERSLMLKISSYVSEENERKMREEGYNKEKFSIYIRPMYNQKFSSLKFEKRTTAEINSVVLASKYEF